MFQSCFFGVSHGLFTCGLNILLETRWSDAGCWLGPVLGGHLSAFLSFAFNEMISLQCGRFSTAKMPQMEAPGFLNRIQIKTLF